MPFLGSQPADQYQSLAKQTITGDGSTAYTLNRSVTNAYDMEVFINNVRQEPDTSYSASGNTITFTAAVTASDSCYLIYQGQSVGSINPPANSVGGSQVANNTITTAHLHTGLSVPDSNIAAMSASKLTGTIAEARMPGVIGFIYRGGTSTWTTGDQTGWYNMGGPGVNATGSALTQRGTLNFDWQSATNYPGNIGGSNFNTTNGLFTAPSDGYYIFGFRAYAALNSTAGDPFIHTLSLVNGNNMSDYGMHGRNDTVSSTMDTPIVNSSFYLAANDTWQCLLYLNEYDKPRVYPNYSYIWGFKVR